MPNLASALLTLLFVKGLLLSVGKAVDIAIESVLTRYLDTAEFTAGQVCTR